MRKPPIYKGKAIAQFREPMDLVMAGHNNLSIATVGHQGVILSVKPARWILNESFGRVTRLLIDGQLWRYQKP